MVCKTYMHPPHRRLRKLARGTGAAMDVNEIGNVCLTDALPRRILHVGLMHERNDAFCRIVSV